MCPPMRSDIVAATAAVTAVAVVVEAALSTVLDALAGPVTVAAALVLLEEARGEMVMLKVGREVREMECCLPPVSAPSSELPPRARD